MWRKSMLLFTLWSTFGTAGASIVNKITCEPVLLHNCTEQKCVDIPVVDIDGKQHFVIDMVQEKMIEKIGKETVDIEHIVSRHGNEHTFVFFGTHADSRFDWILRINKKEGKMILLATDDALNSYTVYGSCRWEESE